MVFHTIPIIPIKATNLSLLLFEISNPPKRRQNEILKMSLIFNRLYIFGMNEDIRRKDFKSVFEWRKSLNPTLSLEMSRIFLTKNCFFFLCSKRKWKRFRIESRVDDVSYLIFRASMLWEMLLRKSWIGFCLSNSTSKPFRAHQIKLGPCLINIFICKMIQKSWINMLQKMAIFLFVAWATVASN